MKRRRALLFSITFMLALCAACGVWLHRERQQYARNRQLIDALLHGRHKIALTLVKAGADPNTLYDPPPQPSIKLLFNQFLHHKPPANNSDTAFRMACREEVDSDIDPSVSEISWHENQPLLEAMLAHGANVNARSIDNGPVLHDAINGARLHTQEWLILHGVDINVQDPQGVTPLMAAETKLAIVRRLLAKGANPNSILAIVRLLLVQS